WLCRNSHPLFDPFRGDRAYRPRGRPLGCGTYPQATISTGPVPHRSKLKLTVLFPSRTCKDCSAELYPNILASTMTSPKGTSSRRNSPCSFVDVARCDPFI